MPKMVYEVEYRALQEKADRRLELLKDADRAISLLYQGATPLLISDKTLTVLDFIQERIKKELSDAKI